MKKKLPFEEALENKFQHLPIPAEETSWQAMSKLLDKNDKRRPLFLRKRYFIFLLTGLLLLAASWGLFRYNETRTGKNKNVAIVVSENTANNSAVADKKNEVNHAATADKETLTETHATANQVKQATKESTGVKEGNSTLIKENTIAAKSQYTKNDPATNIETITSGKDDSLAGNKVSTATTNKKMESVSGNKDAVNSRRRKKSFSKGKQKINIQEVMATADNPITEKMNNKKGISFNNASRINKKKPGGKARVSIKVEAAADEIKEKINTAHVAQQETKDNIDAGNNIIRSMNDVPVKDTLAATILKDSTDSSAKNKIEPVVKAPEKHQKKSGSFTWSGGIGLQQQIPVGNQKFTSYGFNGKNSIIDDYVPSAWLRFERKRKWFLQLEFSYASPRMVSQFPYSRKTTMNNTSTQISTTTLSLKKTYYHEIPLSFNYYIKPRWSVGAGAIYGWLHRAISEEQLSVKNTQNQQLQTNVAIIPAGYTDSFLYRSQFSWMLQTNYEWRRLGFGIRYAMDMQPYIKYTTPAGEINQRRNWSLEFLLRFRIWKHGK